MAQLVNVAAKRFEEVPDSQAAQAIANGTHAYQAGSTVNMVSPQDGNTYAVPAEYVPHFISQGSRIETAGDVQDAQDEAQYGERPLAAGLAGAARGASFGLSDYLGAKLGYGDSLQKLKERNEGASTAGEIAGVVGSAFLPGPNLVKGVGLVGEGVAHAVAPVAERVIGAGAEQGLKAAAQRITGQAIAKGAGSAVEGALYGAGQTLSEDSLGDVQANGELLASQMGISALIGGAIGAAIPVASGLLKGGSKFIPALTQPGEDGYAITKKVNSVYAKLATALGADEGAVNKFYNDGELTKNAFAMGDREAADRIGTAADKFLTAGTEAKDKAYEVLHSQALGKAADDAIASGKLDVGKDLLERTNSVIGDFKQEVEGSKYHSANTKNGVEVAQLTLEGNSPYQKKAWLALRDELGMEVQAGEAPAFHEIPESATPEQQKKILELQFDTALQARKDFDKAIGTTDAKMAAGGHDTTLYTKMRQSLNKVMVDTPVLGEDIARLNEVHANYHENFKDVSKAMSDKAGDAHLQKAVNLVRSSGAKGSMVDSMLDASGGYVDKLKALQTDPNVPQAVKDQLVHVTQQLEESHGALSGLRDAGRNYADLQELKRMAGPSGAGMIAGKLAIGAAGGAINPLISAGLAPALSPYYYAKGMNTLRQTLEKQVDAKRLALIERVIGGQNKTIGDVAANSIKALASGTKVPVILMQAKETESKFKERQALLRAMQNVEPTQLYQSIHNLVGSPAPAHSIAVASVADRAVNYLQAHVPQGTEPPATAVAFERKVALPSKVEMSRFNSIYDVVENPKVALEALGAGTLKAEQVDALKTVYPQMYQQVSTALTTYMANQKNDVPYATRLKLGTWFGTATSKELTPQYLQASQSAFGHVANTDQSSAPQANVSGVGKITLGSRTQTSTQATMAKS